MPADVSTNYKTNNNNSISFPHNKKRKKKTGQGSYLLSNLICDLSN